MDLGGFNRLVETHRRQNGRKPARQHGLAGTRRTDQNDVVPAGHRHFHGALRLILSFDVFEIDVIHALLRKQLFAIDCQRNPGLFAVEQFHYLRQVSHRECPNPVHYSSLACIGLRNDQMTQSPFPGHRGHRERPLDRPDRSVQRQLSHKEEPGQVLRVHTARCAQYSYGHRQIKGRTLFLQICGSEVDSDVLRRQNKSTVAQRRFHSFAAFAHRGIRQTDRHEIQLLPGTEIDFDGYRVRLDAEDCRGLHSKKHSVSFPYIRQSSAHLSENFWLPLLFASSNMKKHGHRFHGFHKNKSAKSVESVAAVQFFV